MISLRKARNAGSLAQFAKDRDKTALGDEVAFNRALASMVGKSKASPATSKPDHSVD
ncbi:MAG: hypothetical protein RL367_586 [Pseudomonadota bacterium]|jgi:hypothetical protein